MYIECVFEVSRRILEIIHSQFTFTWISFTDFTKGNHIYQNGIKDPSLNISLFLTGVVICKVDSSIYCSLICLRECCVRCRSYSALYLQSMECSRFTSDLVRNGTVENHRALDLFAETLAATYGNHSLSFHYDYAVAFTR